MTKDIQGELPAMLQIRSSVRPIVSAGLLLASYILIGFGSTRTTGYSLGTVALGAAIYYLSVLVAVRSKLRWLFKLILTLGAVQAILVTLVCVQMFLDDPDRRWFPICLLLILATIGAMCARLRRLVHPF